MLWRSGLRVAEALALEPKDINLETGQIAVLHGKGDRARIVGMDPMACAIVEKWLERRRKLGVKAGQKVFCVISKPTVGAQLHYSYVRNMVKETAERAGIEKRVHPHGLRHTHAFELAGERVDLRLIRRQLGHGNLAVTARYIEHLNPFEVVEAIRARPWPGHVAAASPAAAAAALPGPSAAGREPARG